MRCISSAKDTRAKKAGFTLVEVLIIAPIVMITITVMIAVIITITGEVLRTQGTSAVAYDTQAALNQIEDDARIATAFVATSYIPNSPQGNTTTAGNVDGSSTFTLTASANPAKLIVRTMALTRSPLSSTRQLIYKVSTCPTVTTTPYTLDAVYFLKTGDSGAPALWRRLLFGTIASAGDYCTVIPWQTPSCSPGYTNTTVCKAEDLKLLENVSSVAVSYYKADGTFTASPVATSIAAKVTIETTDTVAGRTSVNSASIYAKR